MRVRTHGRLIFADFSLVNRQAGSAKCMIKISKGYAQLTHIASDFTLGLVYAGCKIRYSRPTALAAYKLSVSDSKLWIF